MASPLLDYEIRIYHPSVSPYLTLSDYPDPEDFYPHPFSWRFTTARCGGSLGAELTIGGKDHAHLDGSKTGSNWEYLTAGAICLIRMQCVGDAAIKPRYIGMVTDVGMGGGTEPGIRKIECVGLWRLLRQFPLLLVVQGQTILEAVTSINAELGYSRLIPSREDLLTYDADSEYVVDTYDFIDTWANDAIEGMGTLAGPDAAYGVVPTTSENELERGYGQLYFAQVGDEALDYGFEVGSSKTVEELVRTTNAEEVVNGALIIGQQKLAGGDLILWKKPPAGTDIWRIEQLSIPEAVAPEDYWRYGEQYVAGRIDPDHRISFKAPNFGRQAYANEVINAPLAVASTEGGTPFEIWPDQITVSVDEDGSVDTNFELGKRPYDTIASQMPTIYRDIVVARSNMFWSAAELAAKDREIVRDWRRTAVVDGGMRNIWHAPLSDIASVITKKDWELLDIGVPSGWPGYNWRYLAELQYAVGDSGNDTGTMGSIFIPTGPADQPPARCIVFVQSTDRTFSQADRYNWQEGIWTVPDTAYVWLWYDWFGVHPYIHGGAGNAWQGTIVLDQTFTSGIPENPITVWIGRPNIAPGDSTARTTYGLIKAATQVTYVTFGQGSTGSGTGAYCLAIHRQNDGLGGSPLCNVALGWYTSGAFHSNYWSAGSTADATTAPTIDLGAVDNNPIWSLELEVHLPDGTDNTFTCVVRDHDSGDELYDSTDTHGASTVDTGSSPVPTGKYIAGTIYHRSGAWGYDYQPFGIKAVTIPGGGTVEVAATRNGVIWDTGVSGTSFGLSGDGAWADDSVGLRIALNLTNTAAVKAWGVAFRTSDEA